VPGGSAAPAPPAPVPRAPIPPRPPAPQPAAEPAGPQPEHPERAAPQEVLARQRTPDGAHEYFVTRTGQLFRCSDSCDQVQEQYSSILRENSGLASRLVRIRDTFLQFANLEARARQLEEKAREAGPAQKQETEKAREARLDAIERRQQAETELKEFTKDLEDIASFENTLFAGRTSAEKKEMQQLMQRWDRRTYDTTAHSVVDHANRHGFQGNYLNYLRRAAAFDRSVATPTPNPDGTVTWTKKNGEFRIETSEEKIVSYGVNP